MGGVNQGLGGQSPPMMILFGLGVGTPPMHGNVSIFKSLAFASNHSAGYDYYILSSFVKPPRLHELDHPLFSPLIN